MNAIFRFAVIRWMMIPTTKTRKGEFKINEIRHTFVIVI